jgi:flagellin
VIQNLFSSAASIGAASQSWFDSIQRMASGQRVKKSADDAAGSAVLTAIDTVSQSERASIKSVNDGMSLLQGVDGAAEQVQQNLVKMRELAVVAASDTTGAAAKSSLQDQVMQLRDQINQVSQSTEFNGVQLANGAQAAIEVQAGPSSDDQITIDTPDLSSAPLGLDGLDLSTSAGAQAALDALDAAMGEINTVRSEAGAQHNRLTSAAETGSARMVDQASAASQIGDTDFALEASRNANLQIQQQASMAAQVQSQNLSRASAATLLA